MKQKRSGVVTTTSAQMDTNIFHGFKAISIDQGGHKQANSKYLSLTKGEKLIITNTTDSESWWAVTANNPERYGLVHRKSIQVMDISEEPWFYRELPQSLAISALKQEGFGSFLVRTHKRKYILSHWTRHVIEHVFVYKSDSRRFYINNRRRFNTIQELIDYCRSEEGMKLEKYPLPETVDRLLLLDVSNLTVQNSYRLDDRFPWNVRSGSLRNKGDVTVYCMKNKSRKSDEKLLQNQIHLLLCLDHENLVKLLGIGYMDYRLCAILRNPGNVTLREYLHERGKSRLDKPNELLSFSKQICDGMVHLEKRGIVHNELITENCFVEKSAGTVRIGGFHYARFEADNEPLPENFIRKSSVIICPPELCDGQATSSTSDVWAFGLILWSMFCDTTSKGSLTISKIQNYKWPTNSLMWHAVDQIMQACLYSVPQIRPSFSDLQRQMQTWPADMDSDDGFYDAQFGLECILSDDVAIQELDLSSELSSMCGETTGRQSSSATEHRFDGFRETDSSSSSHSEDLFRPHVNYRRSIDCRNGRIYRTNANQHRRSQRASQNSVPYDCSRPASDVLYEDELSTDVERRNSTGSRFSEMSARVTKVEYPICGDRTRRRNRQATRCRLDFEEIEVPQSNSESCQCNCGYSSVTPRDDSIPQCTSSDSGISMYQSPPSCNQSLQEGLNKMTLLAKRYRTLYRREKSEKETIETKFKDLETDCSSKLNVMISMLTSKISDLEKQVSSAKRECRWLKQRNEILTRSMCSSCRQNCSPRIRRSKSVDNFNSDVSDSSFSSQCSPNCTPNRRRSSPVVPSKLSARFERETSSPNRQHSDRNIAIENSSPTRDSDRTDYRRIARYTKLAEDVLSNSDCESEDFRKDSPSRASAERSSGATPKGILKHTIQKMAEENEQCRSRLNELKKEHEFSVLKRRSLSCSELNTSALSHDADVSQNEDSLCSVSTWTSEYSLPSAMNRMLNQSRSIRGNCDVKSDSEDSELVAFTDGNNSYDADGEVFDFSAITDDVTIDAGSDLSESCLSLISSTPDHHRTRQIDDGNQTFRTRKPTEMMMIARQLIHENEQNEYLRRNTYLSATHDSGDGKNQITLL